MKSSQKILVIRFSSIGDIVLATSPLNTIRSAFPDAKITFLTLEKFSSLLEFHPHIDRLISIPSKMKFRELWSFGGYLKRNGYDFIYARFGFFKKFFSEFIIMERKMIKQFASGKIGIGFQVS